VSCLASIYRYLATIRGTAAVAGLCRLRHIFNSLPALHNRPHRRQNVGEVLELGVRYPLVLTVGDEVYNQRVSGPWSPILAKSG